VAPLSGKTEPSNKVVFFASANWFVLSFLSGSVNVGGFLACNRFVTHVTGFATLFGLDFAHGDYDRAVGILSVPLYFLIGAMTSAYLIDRRFHRGLPPRYAWVMGLVALFLCLVVVLGTCDAFGEFGEPMRLKRDYFLLSFLCAASGLQNAAITTSTGAAVRTTHLTGITTDLAIGLVRAHSVRSRKDRYKREMRNNWLRVGTLGAFMGGSVLGAFLFIKLKYLGFILPAGLALYELSIALRFPDMFTRRYEWIRGEI
jgi:uncharacterized membrane protein YoaK (UPF0700 family)